MEFVSSICGFWAQRAAHGLCALCLLTTPEISSPRDRVPLVVWALDFLFCGFLAPVSHLRLFVNKRMLLSSHWRFCVPIWFSLVVLVPGL